MPNNPRFGSFSENFEVQLSNSQKANEKQYGVIYDLIAAGEINGLVGGLSGVYLNDTPLIDDATYKKVRIRQGTGATINGSANTITLGGLFNGVTLNDGDRYVQMVGAAGAASPGGLSTTTNAAQVRGSRNISVGSSTFIDAHALDVTGGTRNFVSDHVGYKIRIAGGGLDGIEYKGIITDVISATEAKIFPPLSTAVGSGANVFIDSFFKVASISSTATAVLTDFTPSSNFTGVKVVLSQAMNFYNDRSQVVNYDNAYVNFKTGTRYQIPIEATTGYGAAPTASYMISPGTNLTWFAGTGGKTLSPNNATASASFIRPNQFNFAQNVKNEIDRVNITISFPSGLRYISPKGNDGPAAVEFQVILKYKTDSSQSAFKKRLVFGQDYGGADFLDGVHQADQDSTTKSNTYSWITAGADFDHQDKIDNYFGHYGAGSRTHPATVVRRGQSASFVHEFPVILSDLQPLHDWEIEVRRLTPDNPIHWNPVEIDGMGAQLFASCNISTVEAQITDKFSYPTSAIAAISYAAEDFSSPPKRSYRIQGRKVKVPTNYITREEAGSVQAKYTRHITNGTDTNSYQSWDGSFRGDQSLAATHVNYRKVYTSNPAWIFYDVLTDKEIGLGDYIEEADVDKYALYQIARYCDEVVSNGKGGTEPRFSCNVYISSQAEAYKVLKDLASSFRAMMYWIDGEIVAIQDSPKEPVYTFTTGNVEDGAFNYSYVGQKARVNQINVTWNNPLELFKKTVLTVEDTQHIESVGKVIPSDIVAFGCTSESQARRLADWHIATTKNEGEVVNFVTGLNGAFLRPGDIINVQDKRRYGFEVSGRVSSGSDTNTINLDRTVTAPGGVNLSDCNLYLIYTEPAVYLKQESATINSIAYTRGQLLLENASGGALVTQAQAANLVDDSGNAVLTHFSENSRVEVKAVNGSVTTGTSASTIEVTGAFSSAPQQDTVWALSRKDDVNTDDLKEYRILSIAQEEDIKFTITASLYAADKFDEIDADVPVVTTDYIPRPKASDPVPAPTGLTFEQLPSSTTAKDGTGTTVSVVASWAAPLESFEDTNGTVTNVPYRFLSHFQIQHTFPSVNNIAQGSNWANIRDINGNANTITFSNVDAGTYTMRVRAINTEGAHSPWNEITREIFSLPPGTSRIARVSRGGFLTFSPEIDASTGLVSIDATAYRYIHPSGEEYIFNPASTAQLQQAFSGLSAGQTAFWVFDASNTSDPWLAMQLHTDSVATDATGNASKFNYLKTIGASNNGLTAASGTVTAAAGSTEVTGSSTAFTTDYYVGAFIKISTNSAAGTQVANSEYREVVEIESNTKLFVRNPFTRAFSGQSPMKQTTEIRFQEDAILAEVTRASSGASPFTAEFYVQGKGAGGSDTIKTVHVFRTGTLPLEVPDPTATELGREAVEGDYVTIHYTDADVVLVYDGTGWGEEAEVIDGNLIREGSLPGDSIEEEATFDKINRLKNAYDAVSQAALTERGKITFRNSADNANPTSWGPVRKIKISTVDSDNKDRSAVFTKITARTHIHIVEDVSDAAQDSGTVPSRAVFKATTGTSVGTSSTSSTITSVGYKSVKVYVSAVNNSIKLGDTFSATGISGLFSTPKVTRVQMSSSPYYVILSTSVPSWSGTRVGTFTRTQHTITVGNPLAAIGFPNYSGNYIVKVQIQSPSEVTTGETIVEGTVTGDALAAATITGAKIAGATIEAANIADATITGAKITDGTISGTKIIDGSITGTEIDSATITSSNIVDGTITGTKIDSATITGSNMVNGTITGTKIDSATITGSNIDSATITGSNIANTTLTGSNMVNGTITGTQIANSTITGGKIAAATIVDANIASGTITGTRIASSTISNSLLLDNTIQGGKIALATIQGGNIATNTITSNNITVTTLSSLSANIGAISSGSLQGGTIPDANGAPSGSETGSFFDLTLGRFVVGNATNYVLWNGTSLVIGGSVIASGNIQSNAVTQAKIASAAVGATEIANLAVQRAKIANDAIDATKVAANAITATEIAANTITASQLTTGAFVTNTANISDGIITNAKIGNLDAGKITSGTIAAGRIDASTITIGNLNGASSFKGALSNLNNPSSAITPTDDTVANTKITAAQVNGNVTNISGGAIQTGTVSAARIDVGSIVIGDLSGASSFKGGLSNLNNPASAVTPISAGQVNGSVTSISGGVITTGTINGNNVNVTNLNASNLTSGTINASVIGVTNLNASNITSGTISASRIAANSISLDKINNVSIESSSSGALALVIGDQGAGGSNAGYYNYGIGRRVMAGLNASDGNIALGYEAGYYVCEGDNFDGYNVAIGHQAAKGLTTGHTSVRNTVVGNNAMMVHTSASYNTCIGNNAGYRILGGDSNVLIGSGALGTTATNSSSYTYPTSNVAIGNSAMFQNFGGSNVAIGTQALYGYLSGSTAKISTGCIAIGQNAGKHALQSGSSSTVLYSIYIGGYAGPVNNYHDQGDYNIAMGYFAKTGRYSDKAISIGYYAGKNSESQGDYNVAIGQNTNFNNTSGGNMVLLGNAATATQNGNQIVLGNSNISSINCNDTSIAGLSDQRDKIDITDLSLGLSFIKSLSPKKFKYNPRQRYITITNEETEDEEGNKVSGDDVVAFDSDAHTAGTDKNEKFSLGFIAQDVQTSISSANESNLALVGEGTLPGDMEVLSLKNGELIPVLVKALKELSDKNDALEARIATLEGG